MHQLDWDIECPDIWSNIILGVSMRILLNEVNRSFDKLKQTALLMPVGLIQSIEDVNRTKSL